MKRTRSLKFVQNMNYNGKFKVWKAPVYLFLCSSLLFSFLKLTPSRTAINTPCLLWRISSIWCRKSCFHPDNQISKGLNYVGLFLIEIWTFRGLTELNLWPSWDSHCYLWNTIFLIPHEEACSLQKTGRSHLLCALALCSNQIPMGTWASVPLTSWWQIIWCK